jgi:hypothetical protein
MKSSSFSLATPKPRGGGLSSLVLDLLVILVIQIEGEDENEGREGVTES